MALTTPKKAGATKNKPLPRVRLELVDTFGRMAQMMGLPRSVGEIYGLLYPASHAMSAPEIAAALSISKGSVSTGTRQLLALGFIRKVWVQRERKDQFEAVLELGDLVRTAYGSIFTVRLQNAERRLDEMIGTLEDDRERLSPEVYALTKERLERLAKLKKRARQLQPILERLIQ